MREHCRDVECVFIPGTSPPDCVCPCVQCDAVRGWPRRRGRSGKRVRPHALLASKPCADPKCSGVVMQRQHEAPSWFARRRFCSRTCGGRFANLIRRGPDAPARAETPT